MVVVTDGFSGNIALKTGEGVAKLIYHFIKEEFTRSIFTKFAAVLAMPAPRKANHTYPVSDPMPNTWMPVTTASAGDRAYVQGLGAETVVDYKTEAFEEKLTQYDAVFDTVGGDLVGRSIPVVRHFGRIAYILPPGGDPDLESLMRFWRDQKPYKVRDT